MVKRSSSRPIKSGLLDNKETEQVLFCADLNNSKRYVHGADHRKDKYDLVPLSGKPFNCITTNTKQTDQVTISQNVQSLNTIAGYTPSILGICKNAEYDTSIQPFGTVYILAGSSSKNTSTCKGSDNKLYEAHYVRNLTSNCLNGEHGTKSLSENLKNQKPFNISSNKDNKCNDYSKDNPGKSSIKGIGKGMSVWTRDADYNCKNITVRIPEKEAANIHPCWVDHYKENPNWNYKLDRYNPTPAGTGPYSQTFCNNECPTFYEAYNIESPQDACKPSVHKALTKNKCKPCPKTESFIGKNKLEKNKKKYLAYHISPKQSNIDSDNIIQNIYIGCLSLIGIYIIYELYKKK